MSNELVGLIGIAAFLIMILLRVPVAYAMIITGIAGFAVIVDLPAALSMIAADLYSTFSSYSLSVIPMFVWMGYIAYYSGVGTSMYKFAYRVIEHWRGGLAIATQAACAIFGAVCGSNTATAATMGTIALPEMKKYGYGQSLSTASIAAGGALGVLIPPSVIFIVYGNCTGISIGKLFISGIIPGILLMLLYMLAIYITVRINPSAGPPGPRFGLREKLDSLKDGILEVVLTFLISLGGLFRGWITPTEAGSVGAASILLITVLRRRLSWKNFKKALSDTVRTTSMIMLIVAGAVIFGRFMAVSRLPFAMADWAAELALPPFAVMAVILFIYFILGCIIDALALVLLTVPIFYPVAVNVLGYDPVWFGVIVVLVVAMGVITPPVGMNVFIIKGVAPEVKLETIFKGVWPFLIAIVVCVIILTAFPALATFLPNLVK